MMRHFLIPALSCALAFSATCAARAGPPYQTDDPEPVAYRNYEIYIGYERLYNVGDNETSLPFAEVNYGPLPNVQIALSIPIGASNALRYGVGRAEFGIKYRFVREGTFAPQIAFYPSIGVPTGVSPPGDPNVATLFLPLWAQKSIGRATLFGGGGWNRNPGAGNRDYWSGGIAGVYRFSERLNAGLELYSNGATRVCERASTSLGLGMNDDYSSLHSVLFSIGRSIEGQPAFRAYAAYELRLGPSSATGR